MEKYQRAVSFLFSIWDAGLHWIMVLAHIFVHMIETSRPFQQFLVYFGIRGSKSSFNRISACQGTVLLPPRSLEDCNKLTVVLDLDETLVCAYDSLGLPPGLHSEVIHSGVKCFRLQCVATDKDDPNSSRITNVTVYERPGVIEFLSRASKFAELVLFTAGLEGYASPLVDEIDPDHRISARLYRPATVTTQFRDHVKDLAQLGRDLRRTVIIDNNPFSFVLQPLNGIPCIPFTGENAHDHELLDVLLPLLEELSVVADVRPVLNEKFHMGTWFGSRGLHMLSSM